MNNQLLEQFEYNILSTWEEVYKKGQLTLWLLLALKDSHKDMSSTKTFIESSTENSISADDQSMYRALRRLVQMELIDYTEQESTKGGPKLKVYDLTESGSSILNQFVSRNIAEVYYKPDIKKLILEGDK